MKTCHFPRLPTALVLGWVLALGQSANFSNEPVASASSADPGQLLHLKTRSRPIKPRDAPADLASPKNAITVSSTNDTVVERDLAWDAKKTALVVCDMWNEHWCKGATRRVAEMAPRMNQVLETARAKGVLIIHCPSETMKYYEGWPQRELAQAAPRVTPKTPLQNWRSLDRSKEPPLPVDDSDGGCDDWPPCPSGAPWKHQIDTLQIRDGDAITDSAEAFYLMQERGIENVIVMGVHANMCVLGRPFSIRQMVAQGKNVVLMRDLTDSMYNSRRPPFVNHYRGTELIIEHIEKYWCPSITSADFLGGEPFHFQSDVRPHIVFLISEPEYHTGETLPEFAKTELEFRGFQCAILQASAKDPNYFPGMEAIRSADLLILSARRRTLPAVQLEAIRQHLKSGKPLVGIRTASHAFDAHPPDAQHVAWPNFDREILGAHYLGHYNNIPPRAPLTQIRIVPAAASHAICTGLPDRFSVSSHLYKNRELANSVQPLLEGNVEGQTQIEPVAWMNTAGGRRVFYTSLGSPDDFKLPAFRRLLLNGILWALDKPIPPATIQALKAAK